MESVSHIPLKPVSSFSSKVNKGWEVLKRHSDLVGRVSIWVLDSFVLIGKMFDQVPKFLGNASKVALSFCGVLWVPTMIRNSENYWEHLKTAVQTRSFEGTVAMTAHCFTTTTDLCLTTGSFLISLARVAGATGIVATYYCYARPIGMASFAVSSLFKFYRPVAKSNIQAKVRELCTQDDKKIDQVFQDVRKNRSKFASEISRNLDPEVWNSFKEKMTSLSTAKEKRELFKTLVPYYQRAELSSYGDLFLEGLGHAGQALCRANPDTLIEAAVLWGFQTLYLAKMGIRKLTEKQTIEEIEQVGSLD